MAIYTIFVGPHAAATCLDNLAAYHAYNKLRTEQVAKGFFSENVYAAIDGVPTWGRTPAIQAQDKALREKQEAEEALKTLPGIYKKYSDLYYEGTTWKALDNIYIDILCMMDLGLSAEELGPWAYAQSTSTAHTPGEREVYANFVRDLKNVKR